jgi:hypothetical protein
LVQAARPAADTASKVATTGSGTASAAAKGATDVVAKTGQGSTTASRVLGSSGRVLSTASRVAGPVAIAASGYRTVTAKTGVDRLEASADTTVLVVGTYGGQVGGAFALGYGGGRLLDEGVGMLTGERISDRLGDSMSAADRALGSVMPKNESKPEYKQESPVAWWLIDTFGL